MTFVQIGEFDWLSGRQIGSIFVKMFKNLFLRNHMRDDFYSGRIRTLVAMATYGSHRLIMGKEEIDNFFCLIGDILNFFLQKCLLSSPLHFI